MNELFGIVTLKCPQCGRNFERLSTDWTYKITREMKTYYYCRYSCWMKALDGFSKKKAPRKVPKLKPEQRVRLIAMIDEGIKAKDIAMELGVTEQLIFYYRRKKKQEESQNEKGQTQ